MFFILQTFYCGGMEEDHLAFIASQDPYYQKKMGGLYHAHSFIEEHQSRLEASNNQFFTRVLERYVSLYTPKKFSDKLVHSLSDRAAGRLMGAQYLLNQVRGE